MTDGGVGARSRFEPVEFDLASLDLNQLDAVTTSLQQRGIYFEARGSVLTVPAAHAEEIQHAISRHAPPITSYGELWSRRSTPSRRVSIAAGGDAGRQTVLELCPRRRRPARWVVDVTVSAVVFSSALAGLAAEWPVAVSWVVASLFTWVGLQIGPTARWGRTAGGLATSTVVLCTDTLEPPGWIRSFMRWCVPQIPGLVALALFELGLGRWVLGLVALGAIFVYGWILVDRDGRGLHDIASRTTVFRRRTVCRPGDDVGG